MIVVTRRQIYIIMGILDNIDYKKSIGFAKGVSASVDMWIFMKGDGWVASALLINRGCQGYISGYRTGHMGKIRPRKKGLELIYYMHQPSVYMKHENDGLTIISGQKNYDFSIQNEPDMVITLSIDSSFTFLQNHWPEITVQFFSLTLEFLELFGFLSPLITPFPT